MNNLLGWRRGPHLPERMPRAVEIAASEPDAPPQRVCTACGRERYWPGSESTCEACRMPARGRGA